MNRQRFGLLLITVVASSFLSAAETSPDRPDSLSIKPSNLILTAANDRQRISVAGQFSDKSTADLTSQVQYASSNPKVATVSNAGVITPTGNGTATITAKLGRLTATANVTSTGIEATRPVDFRTEVIGAFSRGGCNQGACHGSPKGKNGFRLSLRGFDPDVDYQQLTRDIFGRRVNPGEPKSSLILLKAVGEVAHQGGRRFRGNEPAFDTLVRWVAEGCQDSKPKQLSRLEVIPEQRLLHTEHSKQQIVVRAHYADGSVHDVTDLAAFSSADEEVASVSRGGLVEFHETASTAVLVRFLDRIETSELTWIRRDPDFAFPETPENNVVDRHVFARQKTLQLVPSELADDAVFMRRVFLDLTGAIPKPEETQAFLDSEDGQKRSKLIDRLLERDGYAEFWAMKWADVMRGNRETISERGVHNFHRYLVRVFRDDRSFDNVAREILTSLGNTIHEPAANFYRISRSPTETAESFSQLFLGVRIQCAKCHNHPYESITQNDYYGLSAYFSRVQIKGTRFGIDDEVILLKPSGEVQFPGTDRDVEPAAFGVAAGELKDDDDRREKLADWLADSENRFFAGSVVNRVWFHLMGHGIVDPVDDFRDSNLPSNPALLDTLAERFIQDGYRFKPLMRLILNSRTYQLSAKATGRQSPHAANPRRYFTTAVVRMLDAEQIIDAISTATGIPELFPNYPPGTTAVSLAEGNIDHKFLQAFTRPIRDVACECARETDPSLSQVVHLMNNAGVLDKIESPDSRLGKWLAAKRTTDEIIELLYVATLTRRPTEKERSIANGFVQSTKDRQTGLRDLQHALLMSNEFLLRH